MSFAEIAGERGITLPASHGALTWDVEPNTAQRVGARVGPTLGLPEILQLLTRLSLAPAVANTLLDVFPARPMERALVAYDIAARTLLGARDAALVERIEREIAPLRELGPAASVAVPRDRVDRLVDAVCPAPDAEVLVRDFESLPSLAALAQLTRIRPTLEEDSGIVDLVIAHARTLGSAHLPSLAIAFLQILYTTFSVRRALDVMAELACDHDMLYVLPEDMPGQDDASVRLQAYVMLRMHLSSFNTVAARGVLDALRSHSALFDPADPRVLLAATELDILERRRVPEEIAAIIQPFGKPMLGWRYACRVAAGIALRAKPEDAVAIVDEYIKGFGNDAWIWAYARADDSVRAPMWSLLSRELRYASYEPHVWRALSIYLDDGLAIGAQLDQRMAAQLASFFAGVSSLRELERLMSRLRYAKSGQTHYDMWLHHGADSAPEEIRAKADADFDECNRIYREARSALEALVPKLRAEAPREIDAWIDAHDAYLAWVIEDHVARGDAENANVDRANHDRGEWSKLRRGELTFVDETVYYAPHATERYRQLFGFELP